MLNKSETGFASWEQGLSEPSVTDLRMLCVILGVSADYLLGLDSAQTLNVEGLPLSFVAHLTQIIEDYKQK